MAFSVKLNERNVTDDRLIEDLRTVAERFNRDTLTTSEYNDSGRFHSSTMTRRFGSWFDALEKAGLKRSRTPMNLSNDELFDNIRNIWQELGRQPKYGEVHTPLSLYSVGTYDNRFGSWNNALLKFEKWVQDEDENNKVLDIEAVTVGEQERPIIRKTKREISDRMRFRVLMRDGFTCKSCGASPIKSLGVELHVDHIVPWSKGGETIEDNLETKCSKCNLGKSNVFSA